MNRIAAFIVLVFALVVTASAQGPGPSVSVVPVNTVTVTPGKSAPVTISFRVNSGFHINSNKPNSDLLIPTELKLDPPTELMIANIKYPEGEDLSIPIVQEKLNVYSGDFDISALVRPAQNAAVGTFRVHGQLKYQACNNRQCFPPKTTPVEFDVKVVKGNAHRRG